MSINSVEISGNLTRDAEIRITQSGMSIISFGVAVNERKQNQQTGEWNDIAHFVDCVMFDKNGNRQWMTNAMRKGFKVFIRGKLNYSRWQDKETGKNRSKLEVIVNEIDANWPQKQQGYVQQAPQQYQQQSYSQQPPQAPQAPQQAQYTQQQPQQIQQQQTDLYDEDIPF